LRHQLGDGGNRRSSRIWGGEAMSSTILLSNSLTVLADQVRTALEESGAAEKTAIEKALEAGYLLNGAKADCRHGNWLLFLQRAEVPERKAQRYMKLAKSGLKSDTVSDLGGIKATLRWLERLRLPEEDGDLLIVTNGDNPSDDARKAAFLWRDRDGHRFTIMNLAGSFEDTLKRPIIKTEAAWSALFCLFNYRCKDLVFSIIPKDSAILNSLVSPFENYVVALEEVAASETESAAPAEVAQS
jgi:hypothetical protein